MYQIFVVPVRNLKTARKIQFHPAAPVIKYHQKSSSSCCLSSLASEFYYIGDNRYIPALLNSIEESLTLKTENCKNIIDFDHSNMTNRRKIKVEYTLRYNLKIWKKEDAFDMLNYISENVTLVQLMYSLGNLIMSSV